MNENKTTVSEYKIGHTTYVVKTTFNPAFRESLTDVLKRLVIREAESLRRQFRAETKNKN